MNFFDILSIVGASGLFFGIISMFLIPKKYEFKRAIDDLGVKHPVKAFLIDYSSVILSSLGVLLLAIGILGSEIIENASNVLIAVLGICFGLIIGLISAYISYRQSLSRWRRQGFAKARTPRERQINNEFLQRKLPETEKLANRYRYLGSFALVMVGSGILTYYFGKTIKDQFGTFMIAASLAFVLSILGGIYLLSIYADKRIRKSASPSENSRIQ